MIKSKNFNPYGYALPYFTQYTIVYILDTLNYWIKNKETFSEFKSFLNLEFL